MKYFIILAALVPLVAFASGSYETVYVPAGKKLVLVSTKVDSCVVVKAVKFMVPQTTQGVDYSECDKLVVAPTRLPDYCPK